MSRLALLALLASGCFYVDPINQRPSADIVPTMSGELYRGSTIELDATTYDPEDQQVRVAWRAYACTDATTPSGCDVAPFPGGTGNVDKFTFMIPITRDDGTPVEALRVILEATDDRGATAKPPQELLMAVGDHPPDLTLGKQSRYKYVAGTPVQLFATVGDVDDGADKVTLDWQVFTPPSQPTYTLDDLTADPPLDAPTHLAYGKLFMTSGIGDFNFQVTATDPVGKKFPDPPQPMTVTMKADAAPCLSGYTPAAPASPDYLPINTATLFQVLVVSDDLDPYPTIGGDPYYGAEQFAWSLKPPGATSRQPLSIVGNSVAIDPSNYTPGDVLELRVEIQDRNHFDPSVQCADNMDSCSVISDQTCIQRLTWRIEVQ